MPVTWSCIRLMERSSVVLPQPVGPTMAVTLLGSKRVLIPSMSGVPRNLTVRPSIATPSETSSLVATLVPASCMESVTTNRE